METEYIYDVETVEVVRRRYRISARDEQEAHETALGGYLLPYGTTHEPARIDSTVRKEASK